MDFQAKLKAVYKKQNKIAPLIEGLEDEIPQQTLDDYYVKLNIVIKQDDDKKQGNYEKISGKKQEVEIQHIFDKKDNQTEPHRLLILGGAGVGKSTLMQYMAYRWSKGELWDEKFEYVYRITLKTLLNNEWKEDYEKNNLKEDMLKCLAHYQMVASLEETVQLEEMVWLEKKERVLLLLDGYDEVAHERDGRYKGVFTKIFEHENVILTSRPNAIHKEMAEKFAREIENTGLTQDGINQYLTQYFKNDQEKGQELQKFLRTNTSIRDICKIPVNIAMMCFIWSQGESDETFNRISNASDLYNQVVDQLGFRYYTKQYNQTNQDELISRWRGGEIYLDELQVLQHVAYKGMTGGGFEVPDNQRTETLIIKGMTKKGDKDGISIQSSINYLREQLKKDMPTINRIYKYGLLKPDGTLKTSLTKKEASDTDLQAQSFNFLHLSFQEFLTAEYLISKLLSEDLKEQLKVGNFIANHRNEPRYLMTLKFMAGILSSSEDNDVHKKLNIFWDAVLCNPDGVLELGVEAKVTLLMHLIGQTKNETRVPNMSLAVDFIDGVVLGDISGWTAQIKESDYLSVNIKEGMMEYLLKGDKGWLNQKGQEMQKKFDSKSIETNKNLSIEELIEIIVSMIHKFSQEQHHQIFNKLDELLRSYNGEANWQVLKKAIEAMTLVLDKVKLNLEETKKKELLNLLKITMYDSNLDKVSLKTIQQVLTDSDEGLFMETMKDMIEIPKDIKKEAYQIVMDGVFEIANNRNDNQMTKNIANLITPLLSNPEKIVKEVAAATINNLINLIVGTEKQFVKEVINIYNSFWQSTPDYFLKTWITKNIFELAKIGASKTNNEIIRIILKDLDSLIRSLDENSHIKYDVIKTLIEVVKHGNPLDPQFFRDTFIDILIPLWKDDPRARSILESEVFMDILKIVGINQTQIARDILNIFYSFLQSEFLKEPAASVLYELVVISDTKDQQFIRSIITALSDLSQIPEEFTKLWTLKRIVDFVKQADITDPQFLQETIITKFTSLLESSMDTTRFETAQKFTELMKRGNITDPQIVRDIVNILNLLSSSSHVQYAINTTTAVSEALQFVAISDDQLARYIIKTVVGRLGNWYDDVKKPLMEPIFGFMKRKTIIIDTEFVKDFINTLASSFHSCYQWLLKTIALNVAEILRMSGVITETHFVRDFLNSLVSSTLQVEDLLVFLGKITDENEINAQLALHIIAILVGILKKNIDPSVEKLIIEITKKQAAKDSSFLRETMIALAPIFQDSSNGNLLRSGLNIAQEILEVKTTDRGFFKDYIDSLIPILRSPHSDLKLSTLHIVKKALTLVSTDEDEKFIQNLSNVMIENLFDQNEDLRSTASEMIVNIAKGKKELVVYNLKSSSFLMKNPITESFSSFLTGLVTPINMPVIQDSIDTLLSLLTQEDSPHQVKLSASQIIIELVKISKASSDSEFLKNIINSIAPSLQDTNENIQNFCADFITRLIIEINCDKNLVEYSVPLLVPLINNTTEKIRDSAVNHITSLLTKTDTTEFTKGILNNVLVPLLKQPPDLDKNLNHVLKSVAQLAIALQDPELTKSIIQILLSLVKISQSSISFEASKGIIALVKTTSDTQFIRSVVNDLNSLIHHTDSDDTKRCLIDTIGGCVRDTLDSESIREIIVDILIPHLHENDLRSSVSSWIPQIVAKNDPKIARDIIDILLPLLQNQNINQHVTASIQKLAILSDAKDRQFIRDIIIALSALSQDPSESTQSGALETIFELVKESDITDPHFLQETIIGKFSSLLKSKSEGTRFSTAEKFKELMNRGNIKDVQLIRDIVNIATLISPTAHIDCLIKTSSVVAETIKVAAIMDDQLAKDAITTVIGCFKGWHNDAKSPLMESIFELLKTKAIITDTLYMRNLIKTIISLVAAFRNQLWSLTIKNIFELTKVNVGIIDAQFSIEIFNTLVSSAKDAFTADSQENFTTTLEALTPKDDLETAQSLFNALIQVFASLRDRKMISKVIKSIIKIAKKYGGAQNPQFIQDLIQSFAIILENGSPQQKSDVRFILTDLLDARILTKDNPILLLLRPFSSHLESKNDSKAESDLKTLQKLLEITGPLDKQLFTSLFTYLLELFKVFQPQMVNLPSKILIDMIITLSKNDVELIGYSINAIALLLNSNQHTSSNIKIFLKTAVISFAEYSDILIEFLNHSSKQLRDCVSSALLTAIEVYVTRFRSFDEIFQNPSTITEHTVSFKLYCYLGYFHTPPQSITEKIKSLLQDHNALKDFLKIEINHVQNLRGPPIIALALLIFGQANPNEGDSQNRKLVELAREVLLIQTKHHLTEDCLHWINEKNEWLVSLSSETKLFYKKVYHKLLEDSQITPLEEELIIKFINQGLTTSLTREGGIIFEGKRYKLEGKNIEFAVENIAKTIIRQQQDILALQYKEHEPIFKKVSPGGMTEAAADKKNIHSIVDKRNILRNDSWLVTRLKSLKFKSQILLLEQRSAFGDHVIYHVTQQQLFRLYPGDIPADLQDIFGSYIYGEVYQGEIREINDQLGLEILQNSDFDPHTIPDGLLKSKQIYFQQELLQRGTEDRNSAIEQELATKLDNNRALLHNKLQSLNLSEQSQTVSLEEYYEGFVSAFSSTYVSSQAILSGKLSIDDGEDFFSPVNLFIKLVSLAPFGIGEVASSGLETARSHIKTTKITNEARFIKEIAIDSVELSELVSKVALEIIARKEQRERILEEKDEEESQSVVNKVKNLVMEKLEKLKNTAEKYTKMKNLFEKEIQTSPAFRLGECDANKIMSEWINIQGSQLDLRLNLQEKHKKFVRTIVGDIIDEPSSASPTVIINSPEPKSASEFEKSPTEQFIRTKTSCCEIF